MKTIGWDTLHCQTVNLPLLCMWNITVRTGNVLIVIKDVQEDGSHTPFLVIYCLITLSFHHNSMPLSGFNFSREICLDYWIDNVTVASIFAFSQDLSIKTKKKRILPYRGYPSALSFHFMRYNDSITLWLIYSFLMIFLNGKLFRGHKVSNIRFLVQPGPFIAGQIMHILCYNCIW